ncbi:hypothetical protein MBLNU459_g1748t2 [Dothideomycetes sp. NU459]
MDSGKQHLRPLHPRRSTAQNSVSLLHVPRKGSSLRESVSDQTVHSDESSSPGLRTRVGKDSSGESSNADKWFDKSNNDVGEHGATVTDDDPPFFLQQSSSEEAIVEGQARLSLAARQLPAGFSRSGTDGGSTDDFRGVIDDLTIENKKLKRRLKKYEKLHDAHLKDDKLFEIRVHGLPSAHKRELEDLLQKFALSLNNTPDVAPRPNTLHPMLATQKTTSSFNDSAYVSASASGQGSSAQSGSSSARNKHPFKQSDKSRQQHIQTYLHDIPETLLPQHPTVMTDKAKKQLVVRRLEQVFAGKGAAKEGHQHPLQQQEVSKLAANADRSANELLGRRAVTEGTREAHIMRQDGEDSVDTSDVPTEPLEGSTQHLDSRDRVVERDFVDHLPGKTSPQQRPTRPLDLDTQRAQVPAENFEYIRHLGFSPPDLQTMEAFAEGHGWIYLNLLINMAQLHTLNVTADFVQKAIMEYSNKFELSNDGRKVRWRGGTNLTRTSSDGSSDSLDDCAYNDGFSKRQKTSHLGGWSSKNQAAAQRQFQRHQDSRLSYTPLFFHRSSEETSDGSCPYNGESMTESPYPAQAADTSSGMASSGARPGPPKRNRSADGGPIIFYTNARFCTDLSGDHRITENTLDPVVYDLPTVRPVGTTNDFGPQRFSEKRGPLDGADDLPEAMDLCDNPIPGAMEVRFPPQTPMTSESEKSPFELEVSGIGGVYPADNFSINVQVQYERTNDDHTQSLQTKCHKRTYSDRLTNILEEKPRLRKSLSPLREILSTRRKDLPPSELPPAACFVDVDESDSDDDSDAGSVLSLALDEPGQGPPSTAPQVVQVPSWSDYSEEGDDEDDDDDDDDMQSDGSLDLLATARQADPDAIRARELEYDAATAERLAEEIPAGSSAATAGGGSGFASPASGLDPAEYAEARKVRCDLARPCKTCVEREHPELCDYHPPGKKQNTGPGSVAGVTLPNTEERDGPATTSSTVTLSRSDFDHLCSKLESVESALEDLRREIKTNNNNPLVTAQRTPLQLSGRSSPVPNGSSRSDTGQPYLNNQFTRHTSVHGLHARNDLTGQTVHLGGSSVPALVMALGQGDRERPSVQEILGKSILPMFGLDNETATYPFVDLWGLAHGSLARARELAKTIPTDSQCLSFFRYYRDLGNIIFPGVADLATFEGELTVFLITRAEQSGGMGDVGDSSGVGVTEQGIYDRSLQWIGLLFAILASGCQCSGLPRKERELTSQVYMCCSFECLRFTNFLSHATLENIQTLLILGNVISNNMNAGTSWSLMGLTLRLAMSLGLHRSCPPSADAEYKALRSKVWWSIVWQDSLLSITYDRAATTAYIDPSSMPAPSAYTDVPPYHLAMYKLCKVGLEIVRDRTKVMTSRELFARITTHRNEIDAIMRETVQYLRDSRQCRSVEESLEHWALYLHTSYIVSELCRPAISPSTANYELSKAFKQTCIDSLVSTVEAFLGLQNITPYARQSWAAVHRSLSSALLLGIMGEHAHNERARRLLGRFVALMSDMQSALDPQELAAPMERAISALKKLNIQENRPPPRFIEDIAMANPMSSASHSEVASSVAGMDHSSIYPASTSGTTADPDEDHSPYSVLNSILWGHTQTP